jgi:coenzyme F420-reducing hydrogenase alpha subunit
MVGSQPGQIVLKTISEKKIHHTKKRVGGVAQDVGPEFQPKYGQKNQKKICRLII